VDVAIKMLNPSRLDSGKDEFLGEANVMVQLDHPCIVKLIGICQQPQLMLVTIKILQYFTLCPVCDIIEK